MPQNTFPNLYLKGSQDKVVALTQEVDNVTITFSNLIEGVRIINKNAKLNDCKIHFINTKKEVIIIGPLNIKGPVNIIGDGKISTEGEDKVIDHIMFEESSHQGYEIIGDNCSKFNID